MIRFQNLVDVQALSLDLFLDPQQYLFNITIDFDTGGTCSMVLMPDQRMFKDLLPAHPSVLAMN